MSSQQVPTIDLLLNLVPDRPATVLTQLQAHPDLASKRDAHGYSLLHAASSYNHVELAKALINDLHVDPNIIDEDEETCLFNAETVEMAKELLALGVDPSQQNAEGQTAREKLSDEDECPEVGQYLQSLQHGASAAVEGDAALQHPPPLPNGVQVNLGTMQAGEVGEEPDPEFRRRIEELAARGDFDGEDGQRELRNLVQDVVSGIRSGEGVEAPPERRRRVE